MALNAQEIINYIADSPKKTPVKIYVNLSAPVDFGSAEVFGEGKSRIVFGDWAELAPILEDNREKITDCVVENDRRNSGVPLLDLKDLKARIEPGAIIREKVEIGEGAVIMMGAILNIGAVVGKRTMIDMGAVLGGRATVGDDCHIGAEPCWPGWWSPPPATPVVVEDGVLVGANAVVIEGVRIGARGCGGRGRCCDGERPSQRGGGRNPRQDHQDEGRPDGGKDRPGGRLAEPVNWRRSGPAALCRRVPFIRTSKFKTKIWRQSFAVSIAWGGAL